MAESLGEAVLELRTDSRPLEKGLRDAEKGVRGLAGRIGRDFERSLPAIRALGGALVGLGAAYGVAIKAAIEAERVGRLVDNGVKNAAKSFGLTSQSIKNYAAELQRATGIGDDAILESSAILLSFRRIQGETFKEATRLALDMSTVLGTDLNSQVLQLGKALEDPVKGLTALARSGTTFTEQQKDQIKTLVESNRLLDAQKIILAEVEGQYGGAAAAVRDTMGGALTALKEEWGDLLEVIGEQKSGGVLRTAVESWIVALREFREFLPQISIAFFELLSGMAAKAAQFVAQVNFAIIALSDAWRRFFESIGMDRQANAISAFQASVMNELGPQIEFLSDLAEGFGIKSQEALDAWRKGAPDVKAAGVDIAAGIAEAGKAADQIKMGFVPLLEEIRANPLDKWFSDATAPADELHKILMDLGLATEDWDAQIQFVREAMAAAGYSAEQIAQAVARIGNKTVEWGKEAEKVKDAWADINKGFSEAVGRGLHDAAVGFLEEMESGLTDDLPSGLKIFADALLKAANEWLVQMLANIVKAKVAAKGIGAADGGKSSDQSGSWLSSLAKLFKGSGGQTTGAGLSTSAIVGVAAFAVVAAAVAYFKHRRSERDKQRFETDAGIQVSGSFIAGGMSGRLSETGAQVRDALAAVTAAILDSTRALLSGSISAQINIRNDKKAFQAIVEGELIGTFRTANEAIVAAAKKVFSSAQGLSPLVKQVIEGFTGTDPQELANAVARVQEVSDVISGITDIERALQAIPGRIRAVVMDLQMAGVEFADALVAAGQYGVAQFRDAWRMISGNQMTREEEMKFRERQRALLLAQLKLESVRLAQDIANLKVKAAIARGGAGLARAEIAHGVAHLRGQRALVSGEANLLQAQAGVWNNYLNERANFIEAEAGLYDVELAALEAVLAEIDTLIKEVSVGKIKLGGGGGKGLGVDLGSTRATGGVSNWHQRMLDATEGIKEFQRRLVLGDLSPFTGRERVSAAKATYDRLVAQLAMGGRQRILAMEQLPDAAQQYLELFRSTFGSTGQYGIIAGQVNDLMSSILRSRGIEPAQIAEQAAANANAIADSFSKDGRGKLQTRAEEVEAKLETSNRTASQMAISMARVVDLLEDQQNRPVPSAATLTAPAPPRKLGATG